jgi:para-nitrobenzyl esterase
MAMAHARTGAPTWLYRFSVVSAAAPFKGAIHASDRQYVFQTLKDSPWPTDARDAALAKTISAYWVAFAKTGDPNGKSRPVWPRYGVKDELIDFTNDGPVAEPTPDAAALDFVARVEDAPPAGR